MNEQVAAEVNHTATFCENLSLDTPEVRGLFSSDASYNYFYDGPLLRAFSSTGASVGQFDFSKLPVPKTTSDSPTDLAPSILCVSPFNRVNVLVGLEDGCGKGQLYLVNAVFGKILRAFAIPFGVTSIETIHGDSQCNDLPYISGELQHFSGIVACGTKNGQIYIIDMVLDQEIITPPPIQLHPIDIHKGDTPPNRKQLIANKHQALCYSLAFIESSEYFSYISAACEVLHYAQYEDVYISSLKFLPQLGSLCVGYNFGSYQLWRLDPLTLDYSSPVSEDSLPVSHFAFMEPENDPRSFCYLWVTKCSSLASGANLTESMQDYLAGAEANASLYQLAYEQKHFTPAGVPIFKDLMQVGCALKHKLAPDEDVATSWVVSCDTLAHIKSLRSAEDDSQLGTTDTEAYLTAISWRVRYTDGSITSHLALFDINRWYHAQMPKQIRWFDGWCPYFSQYSFDDAVGDKVCAGVYLDPVTISCYKCPRLRQLERFQYPASLRFAVKVLLPSGVASVQYNGVQRQSLLDVVNSSVSCIAQPAAAFQLLRSSGLIPHNTPDESTQRKAVLTTLLLHTHTEYIAKCFNEFSASEGGHSSVTSLMSWLWERLEGVIQEFDRQCTPLYDWSGTWIDKSIRQALLSSIKQTKNIVTLLHHVCLLQEQLPQLELGSVADKLSVAETRLLQMRLVWWCLNRGLLPEVGEGSAASSNGFSYPATTLRRSYNNRHSELLISSSKPAAVLMIDMLANQFGPQLRKALEVEGGQGLYPPCSIKVLLDVFLLDCPLPHKLLYFVYTILDLMALVSTEVNESLSSHTHSLLASIESGKDNSGLSSLALALWSLDHREYKDVITALEQPGALLYLSADLTRKMLARLLDQGQPKAALSMVSLVSSGCTHSVSADLRIAVYLANGMLSAAVGVARSCSSSLELFRKVVTNLKSSREISNLLCLPLTQKELECVKQHLDEKGDLDKLVIHYLQTGNLAEAVQMNKALNSQPLWRGDFKAKERAMTRDRLVKWQLSLLPPIQRKLLEDPHYLQLPTKSRTMRPHVQRRGFFFGNKQPKFLGPVEVAQMVMEKEQAIPLHQRPFIQNLSSSVRPTRKSLALSTFKKTARSITGLFDSPSLGNRSPGKRRAEEADGVPTKRSSSDDSLIRLSGVKSLLRTPLVKRRSHSHLQASAPTITPHSILKMRKPHFRASPSPANLSGQFAATPKFNISTEKYSGTTCKSVTRVKFEMDESDEDLPPPKAIDFNEEESMGEQDEEVEPEVTSVEGESGEASEIEFNMSAPLTQVITGRRKLDEQDQDESFDSALSDLSPAKNVKGVMKESESESHLSPASRDSPPREDLPLDVQVDVESPTPVIHTAHDSSTPQTRKTTSVQNTPSFLKNSGSSASDSLRSLSSLDDEAQLCGLQLRTVREAVMRKDKSFTFSPVTNVARPDEALEVDETTNFTFRTPKPVELERRITRSASKSTKSCVKQFAHSERDKESVELVNPVSSTSTGPRAAPKGSGFSVYQDDQETIAQKNIAPLPDALKPKDLARGLHETELTTSDDGTSCFEPKISVKQDKSLPQSSSTSPQSREEEFVAVGKENEKTVKDVTPCSEPQVSVENSSSSANSSVVVQQDSEPLEEEREESVKDVSSCSEHQVNMEDGISLGETSKSDGLEAVKEKSHETVNDGTSPSEPPASIEDAAPLTQFSAVDQHGDIDESGAMEEGKKETVKDDVTAEEPHTDAEASPVQSSAAIQHDGNKESGAVEEESVEPVMESEELPVQEIRSTEAGLPEVVSSPRPVDRLHQVTNTEAFVFSPVTEVAPRKAAASKDLVTEDFAFATPMAAETSRRQTRSMKKAIASKSAVVPNEDKPEDTSAKSSRKKKQSNPKAAVDEKPEPASAASDGPMDSGSTDEQLPKQKLDALLEEASQHDFAFSPVTQVALPEDVDTQVKVSKKFEFTPPSSVIDKKKGKSKSKASASKEQEVTRGRPRSSQVKKKIKPINIELPEDIFAESVPSPTRVLRSRSSTKSTKPIKPIVIPLPESIFQSAPVVDQETEAATSSSPSRVTRARSRKDSQSSVDSVQSSPARRGRSRKNLGPTPHDKDKPMLSTIAEVGKSTKKTRLRSAPADVDRLNLEVEMERESTIQPSSSQAAQSTKKGRSQKATTSTKKPSTKKSQKATQEQRVSARTRSSVKKPDVSPILPLRESTQSAPAVRARRKL